MRRPRDRFGVENIVTSRAYRLDLCRRTATQRLEEAMYDKILVPTDGSDHAIWTAAHARYLAQLFDATIHVITVIDVQSMIGMFDAGEIDEHFVDRLEDEGTRAIEAVEAAIGEESSIRTEVIRGKPAEAILDYVDAHEIDLLVMGTHGRTGLTRYIAGSVTERVLRLANVPIFTVRTAEQSGEIDYEEVLVPTDGSEHAMAAIDHGLAIAERSDARVHAVNIVDVTDVAMDPSYTPPAELIAQLESEGEAATEIIATRAHAAGLDAVTEVREGFPAKDLLDYAEEHGIDLIVMGTAGRTGLNRFLLGSTTERVIRHAEMPVLAINARDRDD